MEDQPYTIKGRRPLSIQETDLINEIQDIADRVGQFLALMENSTKINFDLEWINIAKPMLRQGFMAMIRAVAKPDNF